MSHRPKRTPCRLPAHAPFVAPLVALIVALIVALAPSAAGAQTDQDVRDLIDRLDSRDLATRQRAELALLAHIQNNRLTAAQLGLLRTYPAGPPLELLLRKQAILERWTTLFPSVGRAVDGVRYQDLGQGLFQLDGFFSLGAVNPGDQTAIDELRRRYEAVRNSLLAADLDRVVVNLDLLQEWVDDSARFARFDFSFLQNPGGGRRATRRDVVAVIQDARRNALQAIQDLRLGSGNVADPGRPPTPVNQQGAIDLGRTLRLALANAPVTPGGLDVFMPAYADALSPPPPGYQFVGEVFDLLATDGLEVAGPVTIGIEYGDVQLIGRPARDPAALRLARLTNGRQELLSDFVNDPQHHVLTAVYVPDSPGTGLEQFGEFVLVQVTPEPATLLLVLGGAAALAARGVRPRA